MQSIEDDEGEEDIVKLSTAILLVVKYLPVTDRAVEKETDEGEQCEYTNTDITF